MSFFECFHKNGLKLPIRWALEGQNALEKVIIEKFTTENFKGFR